MTIAIDTSSGTSSADNSGVSDLVTPPSLTAAGSGELSVILVTGECTTLGTDTSCTFTPPTGWTQPSDGHLYGLLNTNEAGSRAAGCCYEFGVSGTVTPGSYSVAPSTGHHMSLICSSVLVTGATAYNASSTAIDMSASNSSITVALPTGWRAGDIVFIAGSAGASSVTVSFPAGWTKIDNNANALTGVWFFYYRIMQSGDTGPVISATSATTWIYCASDFTAGGGGGSTQFPAGGPNVEPSPVWMHRFGNRNGPTGKLKVPTAPPTRFIDTDASGPEADGGEAITATVTDTDASQSVDSGGQQSAIAAAGTLASNSASGLTTLAHTNNAVGNVLVLATKVSSTTLVVGSVTGGGATGWTRVAGPQNDGTRSQEIWVGTVTATGSQTITVAYSGGSNSGITTDLDVQEFSSSLGTAAIWAGRSSGWLSNGASTVITYPALSPDPGTAELYVGVARVPGAGTITGPPGAFTSQIDLNGNPYIYDLGVTGPAGPVQSDTVSAASGCLAAIITDSSGPPIASWYADYQPAQLPPSFKARFARTRRPVLPQFSPVFVAGTVSVSDSDSSGPETDAGERIGLSDTDASGPEADGAETIGVSDTDASSSTDGGEQAQVISQSDATVQLPPSWTARFGHTQRPVLPLDVPPPAAPVVITDSDLCRGSSESDGPAVPGLAVPGMSDPGTPLSSDATVTSFYPGAWKTQAPPSWRARFGHRARPVLPQGAPLPGAAAVRVSDTDASHGADLNDGTWAVLQSVSATTVSANSFTVTIPSNLTAGSKMVAYVSAAQGTSSVSDGTTNFAQVAGEGYNGGNNNVTVWALDTSPAGDAGTTPTITVSLEAFSGQGASVLVQEITGLVPGEGPQVTDQAPGVAEGSFTSGTTVGPPSYTDTSAGEYLAYVYGDDGGNIAPATWTAPSGYTADPNGQNSNANANIAVAYASSTDGTETGAWTTALSAGTVNYGLILFAFSLAAPIDVIPVSQEASGAETDAGESINVTLSDSDSCTGTEGFTLTVVPVSQEASGPEADGGELLAIRSFEVPLFPSPAFLARFGRKRPPTKVFNPFSFGVNPFDSDNVFGDDSAFSFLSDSDGSASPAQDLENAFTFSDTDASGRAADLEQSSFPSDSDAVTAEFASGLPSGQYEYWSGPLADTDASHAASDGPDPVRFFFSDFTETCTGDDEHVIDVYTFQPPFRFTGGGYEIVIHHPVHGERVIWRGTGLTRAILDWGRALLAGPVELPADGDRGYTEELEEPGLHVTVVAAEALDVRAEVTPWP